MPIKQIRRVSSINQPLTQGGEDTLFFVENGTNMDMVLSGPLVDGSIDVYYIRNNTDILDHLATLLGDGISVMFDPSDENVTTRLLYEGTVLSIKDVDDTWLMLNPDQTAYSDLNNTPATLAELEELVNTAHTHLNELTLSGISEVNGNLSFNDVEMKSKVQWETE